MNKKDIIKKYIVEFLHVNEEANNRMMDLYGNGKTSFITINISDSRSNQDKLYDRIVSRIKERYGKPANTALRDSSLQGTVGNVDEINVLDWAIYRNETASNDTKLKLLNKLANTSLAELKQKGVNSLFMSVGAIKWDVPDPNDSQKTISITTPLLIFPIKLVRAVGLMPVMIDFVADDIRLNPCLIEKINRVYSEELAEKFPRPRLVEGSVDINALDIVDYFSSVNTYIGENFRDSRREFKLLNNSVAISNFNSLDIAMYYDLINHQKQLEDSQMIEKLFSSVTRIDNEQIEKPLVTLPADVVQEKILARAVNGDDMIIKGPPGTGKTLTIANLIASLMGAGKKVMFVSAKTSALAEVCNKLPECLRPFVLELFCESEAEAANFSVVDLTNSLRKARDAEPVKDESLLLHEIQGYKNRRDEAINYLNGYKEYYFTNPNPVSGHAFYSTINKALKYDGDPQLRGAFIGKTSRITVEDYDKMHSATALCETNLNHITNNGEKIAVDGPWYDADAKVTPLMIEGEIKRIVSGLEIISKKIREFLDELGIKDKDDTLPLSLFMSIIEAEFSKEEINKIIVGNIRPSVLQSLEEKTMEFYMDKSLDDYLTKAISYKLTLSCQDEEAVKKAIEQLKNKAKSNKSVSELREIKGSIEKMNLAVSDSCDIVLDVFERYSEKNKALKEIDEEIDKLIAVVGKQRDARRELLELHSSTLAKYAQKDVQKFGIFESKAKKAYEEIARLPISKTPSINEVTKACELYENQKTVEVEKQEVFNRFVEMFGDEVTEEDVIKVESFISIGGDKASKKIILDNLLEEAILVEKARGMISSSLERVESELDNKNANELSSYLICALERARIEDLYSLVCKELGLESKELKDLEEPNTIIALRKLTEYFAYNQSRVDTICRFINENENILNGLVELKNFAFKYELNPKYTDIESLTLADIDRFIEDIADARISNACQQLKQTMQEDAHGCFKAFLEYFATGKSPLPKRGELNMTQLLEYAYFNACTIDTEGALTRQGNAVYDGTKLRAMEKNLISASTMLARGQAKYIAHKLSIKDKTSPKYAFLNNEKPSNISARVFFKENAKAILSLARCMVLSPYSVSVFMKPQEYFDYDVLIVDEASQLHAREILPCAIRAKQVVLVGDQNQMPPINYFQRKDNAQSKEDDEDEGSNMSQADSILDLAIKNKSIATAELLCHYRSRNETLIAYSQKKYYDNMTTFPTANPGQDGRGLVDVFVDGGHVDSVNIVEARKVVELIEQHFDTYFDEEAKMLRESLGIVVFGQKQLECITKLIDRSPVREKIKLARTNTRENPDKTYFITAVDAVQGQEIEHLIISLTYCKREADGKVKQSFGMLNRTDNGERLGERIFNVAVTRAIKSLTFVHSVHSHEIVKPTLAHLREYLEMLESLGSRDEETQPKFVSNKDKVDEFALSVKRAITELIADEDRIVYGYGVTEKSLRIPIVILNKDKTHADLGIFCETDIADGERYTDTWVNYPETLEARGWKLHRMYIHDWYFNREAELKALKNAIQAFITE